MPGVGKHAERGGDPDVVVEHDLGGGCRARDAVADRHQHGAPGDLRPVLRAGIDPQHDERVDPLIHELVGQLALQFGVVGGVDDQRVPIVLEQLAPESRCDALLPDVLQRTAQHADVAGTPGRERSSDGVDLVAEPVGDVAHAQLRLDRHVQPA